MSPAVAELVATSAASWVRFLLLNSLYGAIVFAAVAGCLALLPTAAPRFRRAVWLLVMVRLLLPPDLSHPWSVGALAAGWGADSRSLLTGIDGGFEDSAAHLPPGSAADGRATGRRARWPLWLGGLWLAGFGVALLGWRRAVRPFRVAARHATTATDPSLVELAERWRRRLGVRRRVELRLCERLPTAFTLGLLRPVIVLPLPALVRPAVIEPAIAHEMVHVARFDALWLAAERLARCVYFFHPLVRLACDGLDHERERCCDERVVATGGLTARAYAGGLVEAVGLGRAAAGAITFIPRRRRITMRIESILEPRRRTFLAGRIVLLPVIVAGFAGLPMAAGVAVEPVGPESGFQFVPAAAAPSSTLPGLAHPLPGGRLTMAWGEGRNPLTHKVFHHDGVDLGAPLGTPVRAAADGEVVVAVVDFGDSPRGRTVVLAHDGGLVTSYSHLEGVLVTPGQRVTRAETIGTVGSTGRSTGPHLHLEVRRDGKLVDPATMVEGLWPPFS